MPDFAAVKQLIKTRRLLRNFLGPSVAHLMSLAAVASSFWQKCIMMTTPIDLSRLSHRAGEQLP